MSLFNYIKSQLPSMPNTQIMKDMGASEELIEYIKNTTENTNLGMLATYDCEPDDDDDDTMDCPEDAYAHEGLLIATSATEGIFEAPYEGENYPVPISVFEEDGKKYLSVGMFEDEAYENAGIDFTDCFAPQTLKALDAMDAEKFLVKLTESWNNGGKAVNITVNELLRD